MDANIEDDGVEDAEEAGDTEALADSEAAASVPGDVTGSISAASGRGSQDRGADRSMGCCSLLPGDTCASA